MPAGIITQSGSGRSGYNFVSLQARRAAYAMLDCYESSPVIGEWEMACGFCFDYVEVLKTLDKAVSDGWSNDGSKDALDTPAMAARCARGASGKLLNRRFP